MVIPTSWQPGKALPGALLFGMFDALRIRLQTEARAMVPPLTIMMTPFIPSIIAL